MSWPQAVFYSVATIVAAVVVLYVVERVHDYKTKKLGR